MDSGFGDLRNPLFRQWYQPLFYPTRRPVVYFNTGRLRLRPTGQIGRGSVGYILKAAGSFRNMIFLIPDRHFIWWFLHFNKIKERIKMKPTALSILFGTMLTLAMPPAPTWAAKYITNKGWAAPCPKTGQDTAVASECSSWCKSTYGTTKYGTTVTSFSCDALDFESTYKYCCGNNAARDIVLNCRCADAHQITVADKTGGRSYTKTASGSAYEYTCSNLYCYCNSQYYGARQTMSASTSGACTKCPCVANTYYKTNNAQMCGSTPNTYSQLTDNTKAPSTTITNCAVGPVSSAVPVQYRTYYDNTGTFEMTGSCSYTK